jgi:hypothetical protein
LSQQATTSQSIISVQSLPSNVANLEHSDSNHAVEQPIIPLQQPARTLEAVITIMTARRIPSKNLFFTINPPLYRSLKQQ